MQNEREKEKQSLLEKDKTTRITTTTGKRTVPLHIDFTGQTNKCRNLCLCVFCTMRVGEDLPFSFVQFCIYNQNRVLRSTAGFFGAIDGFGLDAGDGTDVGGDDDDGNCGRPAAAIMVVIRCCCIMNIIIEAAIGLKRAGLGPGKTVLKSGMGEGVAILL